eukprot:s1993_g6.t1
MTDMHGICEGLRADNYTLFTLQDFQRLSKAFEAVQGILGRLQPESGFWHQSKHSKCLIDPVRGLPLAAEYIYLLYSQSVQTYADLDRA